MQRVLTGSNVEDLRILTHQTGPIPETNWVIKDQLLVGKCASCPRDIAHVIDAGISVFIYLNSGSASMDPNPSTPAATYSASVCLPSSKNNFPPSSLTPITAAEISAYEASALDVLPSNTNSGQFYAKDVLCVYKEMLQYRTQRRRALSSLKIPYSFQDAILTPFRPLVPATSPVAAQLAQMVYNPYALPSLLCAPMPEMGMKVVSYPFKFEDYHEAMLATQAQALKERQARERGGLPPAPPRIPSPAAKKPLRPSSSSRLRPSSASIAGSELDLAAHCVPERAVVDLLLIATDIASLIAEGHRVFVCCQDGLGASQAAAGVAMGMLMCLTAEEVLALLQLYCDASTVFQQQLQAAASTSASHVSPDAVRARSSPVSAVMGIDANKASLQSTTAATAPSVDTSTRVLRRAVVLGSTGVSPALYPSPHAQTYTHPLTQTHVCYHGNLSMQIFPTDTARTPMKREGSAITQGQSMVSGEAYTSVGADMAVATSKSAYTADENRPPASAGELPTVPTSPPRPHVCKDMSDPLTVTAPDPHASTYHQYDNRQTNPFGHILRVRTHQGVQDVVVADAFVLPTTFPAALVRLALKLALSPPLRLSCVGIYRGFSPSISIFAQLYQYGCLGTSPATALMKEEVYSPQTVLSSSTRGDSLTRKESPIKSYAFQSLSAASTTAAPSLPALTLLYSRWRAQGWLDPLYRWRERTHLVWEHTKRHYILTGVCPFTGTLLSHGARAQYMSELGYLSDVGASKLDELRVYITHLQRMHGTTAAPGSPIADADVASDDDTSMHAEKKTNLPTFGLESLFSLSAASLARERVGEVVWTWARRRCEDAWVREVCMERENVYFRAYMQQIGYQCAQKIGQHVVSEVLAPSSDDAALSVWSAWSNSSASTVGGMSQLLLHIPPLHVRFDTLDVEAPMHTACVVKTTGCDDIEGDSVDRNYQAESIHSGHVSTSGRRNRKHHAHNLYRKLSSQTYADMFYPVSVEPQWNNRGVLINKKAVCVGEKWDKREPRESYPIPPHCSDEKCDYDAVATRIPVISPTSLIFLPPTLTHFDTADGSICADGEGVLFWPEEDVEWPEHSIHACAEAAFSTIRALQACVEEIQGGPRVCAQVTVKPGSLASAILPPHAQVHARVCDGGSERVSEVAGGGAQDGVATKDQSGGRVDAEDMHVDAVEVEIHVYIGAAHGTVVSQDPHPPNTAQIESSVGTQSSAVMCTGVTVVKTAEDMGVRKLQQTQLQTYLQHAFETHDHPYTQLGVPAPLSAMGDQGACGGVVVAHPLLHHYRLERTESWAGQEEWQIREYDTNPAVGMAAVRSGSTDLETSTGMHLHRCVDRAEGDTMEKHSVELDILFTNNAFWETMYPGKDYIPAESVCSSTDPPLTRENISLLHEIDNEYERWVHCDDKHTLKHFHSEASEEDARAVCSAMIITQKPTLALRRRKSAPWVFWYGGPYAPPEPTKVDVMAEDSSAVGTLLCKPDLPTPRHASTPVPTHVSALACAHAPTPIEPRSIPNMIIATPATTSQPLQLSPPASSAMRRVPLVATHMPLVPTDSDMLEHSSSPPSSPSLSPTPSLPLTPSIPQSHSLPCNLTRVLAAHTQALAAMDESLPLRVLTRPSGATPSRLALMSLGAAAVAPHSSTVTEESLSLAAPLPMPPSAPASGETPAYEPVAILAPVPSQHASTSTYALSSAAASTPFTSSPPFSPLTAPPPSSFLRISSFASHFSSTSATTRTSKKTRRKRKQPRLHRFDALKTSFARIPAHALQPPKRPSKRSYHSELLRPSRYRAVHALYQPLCILARSPRLPTSTCDCSSPPSTLVSTHTFPLIHLFAYPSTSIGSFARRYRASLLSAVLSPTLRALAWDPHPPPLLSHPYPDHIVTAHARTPSLDRLPGESYIQVASHSGKISHDSSISHCSPSPPPPCSSPLRSLASLLTSHTPTLTQTLLRARMHRSHILFQRGDTTCSVQSLLAALSTPPNTATYNDSAHDTATRNKDGGAMATHLDAAATATASCIAMSTALAPCETSGPSASPLAHSSLFPSSPPSLDCLFLNEYRRRACLGLLSSTLAPQRRITNRLTDAHFLLYPSLMQQHAPIRRMHPPSSCMLTTNMSDAAAVTLTDFPPLSPREMLRWWAVACGLTWLEPPCGDINTLTHTSPCVTDTSAGMSRGAGLVDNDTPAATEDLCSHQYNVAVNTCKDTITTATAPAGAPMHATASDEGGSSPQVRPLFHLLTALFTDPTDAAQQPYVPDTTICGNSETQPRAPHARPRPYLALLARSSGTLRCVDPDWFNLPENVLRKYLAIPKASANPEGSSWPLFLRPIIPHLSTSSPTHTTASLSPTHTPTHTLTASHIRAHTHTHHHSFWANVLLHNGYLWSLVALVQQEQDSTADIDIALADLPSHITAVLTTSLLSKDVVAEARVVAAGATVQGTATSVAGEKVVPYVGDASVANVDTPCGGAVDTRTGATAHAAVKTVCALSAAPVASVAAIAAATAVAAGRGEDKDKANCSGNVPIIAPDVHQEIDHALILATTAAAPAPSLPLTSALSLSLDACDTLSLAAISIRGLTNPTHALADTTLSPQLLHAHSHDAASIHAAPALATKVSVVRRYASTASTCASLAFSSEDTLLPEPPAATDDAAEAPFTALQLHCPSSTATSVSNAALLPHTLANQGSLANDKPKCLPTVSLPSLPSLSLDSNVITLPISLSSIPASTTLASDTLLSELSCSSPHPPAAASSALSVTCSSSPIPETVYFTTLSSPPAIARATSLCMEATAPHFTARSLSSPGINIPIAVIAAHASSPSVAFDMAHGTAATQSVDNIAGYPIELAPTPQPAVAPPFPGETGTQNTNTNTSGESSTTDEDQVVKYTPLLIIEPISTSTTPTATDPEEVATHPTTVSSATLPNRNSSLQTFNRTFLRRLSSPDASVGAPASPRSHRTPSPHPLHPPQQQQQGDHREQQDHSHLPPPTSTLHPPSFFPTPPPPGLLPSSTSRLPQPLATIYPQNVLRAYSPFATTTSLSSRDEDSSYNFSHTSPAFSRTLALPSPTSTAPTDPRKPPRLPLTPRPDLIPSLSRSALTASTDSLAGIDTTMCIPASAAVGSAQERDDVSLATYTIALLPPVDLPAIDITDTARRTEVDSRDAGEGPADVTRLTSSSTLAPLTLLRQLSSLSPSPSPSCIANPFNPPSPSPTPTPSLTLHVATPPVSRTVSPAPSAVTESVCVYPLYPQSPPRAHASTQSTGEATPAAVVAGVAALETYLPMRPQTAPPDTQLFSSRSTNPVTPHHLATTSTTITAVPTDTTDTIPTAAPCVHTDHSSPQPSPSASPPAPSPSRHGPVPSKAICVRVVTPPPPLPLSAHSPRTSPHHPSPQHVSAVDPQLSLSSSTLSPPTAPSPAIHRPQSRRLLSFNSFPSIPSTPIASAASATASGASAERMEECMSACERAPTSLHALTPASPPRHTPTRAHRRHVSMDINAETHSPRACSPMHTPCLKHRRVSLTRTHMPSSPAPALAHSSSPTSSSPHRTQHSRVVSDGSPRHPYPAFNTPRSPSPTLARTHHAARPPSPRAIALAPLSPIATPHPSSQRPLVHSGPPSQPSSPRHPHSRSNTGTATKQTQQIRPAEPPSANSLPLHLSSSPSSSLSHQQDQQLTARTSATALCPPLSPGHSSHPRTPRAPQTPQNPIRSPPSRSPQAPPTPQPAMVGRKRIMPFPFTPMHSPFSSPALSGTSAHNNTLPPPHISITSPLGVGNANITTPMLTGTYNPRLATLASPDASLVASHPSSSSPPAVTIAANSASASQLTPPTTITSASTAPIDPDAVTAPSLTPTAVDLHLVIPRPPSLPPPRYQRPRTTSTPSSFGASARNSFNPNSHLNSEDFPLQECPLRVSAPHIQPRTAPPILVPSDTATRPLAHTSQPGDNILSSRRVSLSPAALAPSELHAPSDTMSTGTASTYADAAVPLRHSLANTAPSLHSHTCAHTHILTPTLTPIYARPHAQPQTHTSTHGPTLSPTPASHLAPSEDYYRTSTHENSPVKTVRTSLSARTATSSTFLYTPPHPTTRSSRGTSPAYTPRDTHTPLEVAYTIDTQTSSRGAHTPSVPIRTSRPGSTADVQRTEETVYTTAEDLMRAPHLRGVRGMHDRASGNSMTMYGHRHAHVRMHNTRLSGNSAVTVHSTRSENYGLITAHGMSARGGASGGDTRSSAADMCPVSCESSVRRLSTNSGITATSAVTVGNVAFSATSGDSSVAGEGLTHTHMPVRGRTSQGASGVPPILPYLHPYARRSGTLAPPQPHSPSSSHSHQSFSSSTSTFLHPVPSHLRQSFRPSSSVLPVTIPLSPPPLFTCTSAPIDALASPPPCLSATASAPAAPSPVNSEPAFSPLPQLSPTVTSAHTTRNYTLAAPQNTHAQALLPKLPSNTTETHSVSTALPLLSTPLPPISTSLSMLDAKHPALPLPPLPPLPTPSLMHVSSSSSATSLPHIQSTLTSSALLPTPHSPALSTPLSPTSTNTFPTPVSETPHPHSYHPSQFIAPAPLLMPGPSPSMPPAPFPPNHTLPISPPSLPPSRPSSSSRLPSSLSHLVGSSRSSHSSTLYNHLSRNNSDASSFHTPLPLRSSRELTPPQQLPIQAYRPYTRADTPVLACASVPMGPARRASVEAVLPQAHSPPPSVQSLQLGTIHSPTR